MDLETKKRNTFNFENINTVDGRVNVAGCCRNQDRAFRRMTLALEKIAENVERKDRAFRRTVVALEKIAENLEAEDYGI